MFEHTLGLETPALADPLLNLAALYIAEHRFADAAPLFKRALPLREAALGPLNPKLADAIESYAMVMRKLEEYAEAEKLQAQATRIRVRTALRADAEAGA
jgi:tetratricopeptide (TPR) repeat protein